MSAGEFNFYRKAYMEKVAAIANRRKVYCK